MDLGIATRPKRGESVNGDAYFVGEYDGEVLLGVIDGVGHGEEANSAALRAISFLENHRHRSADAILEEKFLENHRHRSGDATLEAIIKGCHRELRGTRGIVMGLALINSGSGTLSHAGIGNIEGRIIKQNNTMSHLISMNGIIGYNLRKVKEFQYSYRPGDIMVMFSDGISSRFDIAEFLPLVNLQTVAERILEKYSKDDDATVLLVRVNT